MNSFLMNSIVINREPPVDGGLFVQNENGDVLARLDRFIVVPIERIPDLDAFLRSLGINTDPTAISV